MIQLLCAIVYKIVVGFAHLLSIHFEESIIKSNCPSEESINKTNCP